MVIITAHYGHRLITRLSGTQFLTQTPTKAIPHNARMSPSSKHYVAPRLSCYAPCPSLPRHGRTSRLSRSTSAPPRDVSCFVTAPVTCWEQTCVRQWLLSVVGCPAPWVVWRWRYRHMRDLNSSAGSCDVSTQRLYYFDKGHWITLGLFKCSMSVKVL